MIKIYILHTFSTFLISDLSLTSLDVPETENVSLETRQCQCIFETKIPGMKALGSTIRRDRREKRHRSVI